MTTFAQYSSDTAYRNKNQAWGFGHKIQKVLVSGVIIALFSLVASSPVSAAIYECKPEHAYVWDHGQLKDSSFMKKMGILFQQSSDEGTLSMGMKAPWAQTGLKITQRITPTTELVASAENKGTKTTLRIRKIVDVNNAKFILLGDSFDAPIYIGNCTVTNE